MVVFKNYPLPPSENAIYRPRKAYEKGTGMKMTKQGYDYIKRVEYWKIQNYTDVVMNSAKIKSWIDEYQVVLVNFVICFDRSELWTQAGEPKIMDATNRIKILQDTLAQVLRFDDKMVFHCTVEKCEADDAFERGVQVILKPMRARTATQVMNSLGVL